MTTVVAWHVQGKGKASRRRQMPRLFALKELSSPKVFYPGTSGDIRDYLPLNEPSIQRFLKHATIVETYWADVRCLDPKTDAPLDITAYDLTVDAEEGGAADPFAEKSARQSWTPLERLRDVELSCSRVAETRRIGGAPEPQGIKLQMRIAMEHCDLGALRVRCALHMLPGGTTVALARRMCSGVSFHSGAPTPGGAATTHFSSGYAVCCVLGVMDNGPSAVPNPVAVQGR